MGETYCKYNSFRSFFSIFILGVIQEREDDKELRLITNNPEPLRIPLARIKQRENMPSSMPAMATLMSKREIRDVIEFLSSLK